jgi:AcrR family transcriptional regulator
VAEKSVLLQVTGPPTPETLRPDQRERRERIVRAALKALLTSEYEQVKISDVARESHVALGTVYRYFASKEHLFAAAYYEWMHALESQLDRAVPRGATEAERLGDVFRRVIKAFQVQPQFFRVMMMLEMTTDAYASEVYVSLSDLFESTMEPAFGGPLDDDRRAVFLVLSAVLNGGLRAWVSGRQSINDVYRAVDETLRLIYDEKLGDPPRTRSS